MDNNKSFKIIVLDILLFFSYTFLFILDYKIEPIVILLFSIILNLIYIYLDNIKIRYDMIYGKKVLICASIDNINLIDLYYGDDGRNIIKKVYKIIKKNISYVGLVKKYNGYFVIIDKYNNRNEVISLVNKINEETQQLLSDEVFNISLSFGIQLCKDDSDYSSDEKKATIACSNAKKEYLNLYSFYNDEDMENEIREKQILNSLVRSLKNNEFEVFFQPKYNNNDNTIVGSEALARLVQNGEIVPAKYFIDVAEKYNFTSSLDKYIFREVCKKIRELKKNKIKFNTISVNVSRNTLCENTIVDYYESIMRRYEVDKKDIELEVTERNANGYILSNEILKELCRKFNVSIDDFGIGNSSLSVLRELKIKTVKIDRAFIIDESISGRKILDNIIKLIKDLDLDIVAEGVDAESQNIYLKKRGCTIVQGYLYSKPLSFDEYKNLLSGGDGNGS